MFQNLFDALFNCHLNRILKLLMGNHRVVFKCFQSKGGWNRTIFFARGFQPFLHYHLEIFKSLFCCGSISDTTWQFPDLSKVNPVLSTPNHVH